MAEPTRILLADDHPVVREGIRSQLARERDLQVIGEAADGDLVRRLVVELQPDIVLLDLNMPRSSPRSTIPYLRETCPAVRILILSAYDDLLPVETLLKLGVKGYILKDEAPGLVVGALRAVAEGRTWFSQQVIEQMVWPAGAAALESFTSREIEVLQLLARGWPNRRIAATLGVSERTVRYHLQNLASKLHMASRDDLLVWAVESAFGHRPQWDVAG